MQVFIKILKIITGVILGLVFSFLTIVCLEIVLPKPNPFRAEGLNLWLTAPIVAAWVFFLLWLLLRKPTAKKNHTPGIELLPESSSELIDGIIDAMKYRRSVCADVRQELMDHFTNALADCETDDKKQQASKELIEEFGDVELLGKLLRRAKKRCRPLWRTMVARLSQLVGVSFLLLILYIGWFFTGKPQITNNYLEIMNQQVRPIADDSQNAWPYYKQAAEKYIKYENKEYDFHPTNASPFTRSKEDWEIIQQSIKDNQESLVLIRQGNHKPYYWQVYDVGENEKKEMLSMLIPHLSDYKNLTFLMCWQGLLNAEQGNFEKAFKDTLEVYSFGQHLRGQNTTFVEQLVAIGIESMSTKTLRMILAGYGEQIDTPLLESARKRFEALIADKDFSIDFESEKLFLHDEAQRCFTKSRFGKSHLYLPRLKELGALEIDKLDISDKDEVAVWIKGGLHVIFTHPDKEQTLREVEQFYAEMKKLSSMTPASVKAQGLDLKQFESGAIKNNVFLDVLIPALSKMVAYSYRYRVDSKATLTILGVMQYEKEYGQLPESLDILAKKGFLREVPIDPFSNESLVYRKTEDGFTLYSVGFNFTDDGGVPSEYKGSPQSRRWDQEGDAVFWPMDKEE